MLKWILCAIVGNIIALFMPVLPSISVLIILSIIFFVLAPVRIRISGLVLIISFSWTVTYSHYQLHQKLPEPWQGKAFIVEGYIDSIPDINQHRAQFLFRTTKLCKQQDCQTWKRNIQLSWYGEHPPLSVNQHWRFFVRLKRGRGLLNPVGMDYSAYLLQAKIAGIGYINAKEQNVLLSDSKKKNLLALRATLHHMIELAIDTKKVRGIVNALTIGEKSEISKMDWKILQATGTNHLVAISGLHIGMIAGLFFLIGQRLWRIHSKLLLYLPAQHAGAIIAMIAAFIYAGLAGFAIPTQRALIMLVFALFAILSHRKLTLFQLLLYAWIAILIDNPLAVLSRGFCLSFLAVFILNYGFFNRLEKSSSFMTWFKAQWLIGFGMLPITLIYFGQYSVVGFVANVIAIPLVGFIIVPVILFVCFWNWLFPEYSAWLWFLVEKLIELFWQLLTYLAKLPHSVWYPHFTQPWLIAIVIIAIIILLAPRGLPGRSLAWFGLFPLLLPYSGLLSGQAKVTLLDVGQGLAVVVQTRHHTLLYDTGPRFFDYDTGDAVIIPYLHQQGIHQIDKLVVSHMDLDHRGGVTSIMNSLKVLDFLTSEPSFYPQYHPHACERGQQWQWDGITFDVLFPPQNWQGSRNDGSCVLRMSVGNKSLLLTGDIEKQAENFLLEYEANLSSKILLIPHHGSKTSSSIEFIKKVDPKIGLIANGYRNRYRLPHQSIIRRYQQQQVQLFETGQQGAVEFILEDGKNPKIETYRSKHHHFWL